MGTISPTFNQNDFRYGPLAGSFETSALGDEPLLSHGEYVDGLADTQAEQSAQAEYARAAIEAATDQIEAYANDPVNAVEAYSNDPTSHIAEATAESRAAIDALNADQELARARERAVDKRIGETAGRYLQGVRDEVVSAGEVTRKDPFLFLRSKEDRMAARVAHMSERQLIQAESEVGSAIFGPVAAGGRREFFCLNEDAWIWYEKWADQDGKLSERTTRYEYRADDIIKSQDGEKRTYISNAELHNLANAQRLYYDRVMRSVYHRDPATSRPLVDIL